MHSVSQNGQRMMSKLTEPLMLILSNFSNNSFLRSEISEQKCSFSPKAELEILIKTTNTEVAENLTSNQWILEQLQSLSAITIGANVEKPKACSSSLVDGHELYVPLAGLIDVNKERERIESEIKRIEGWLKGVNGKLNNANFVNNARMPWLKMSAIKSVMVRQI